MAKVINCLGDSRVRIFEYLEINRLLGSTKFTCTEAPGGTALGMVNPNSTSDALNIFSDKLESYNTSDNILFMLGEVDCGFEIWYRSQKYGISVNEQLAISLNNYFGFLTKGNRLGFEKIIICTANPPTIKDGQTFGEVANLRKEVKASQRERTDLTILYNSYLRELCAKHGYLVLDTERYLLNLVTHLVDDRFLNSNPTDHHLDSPSIAPVYVQCLASLGFN
ncbi:MULTISPECIES: hypothetical protein [Paenibacillus]|uniref:hypothetical protein n=1 Tax=Paenibacillus TaxID=44249 RepID=UPI0019158930|nr:hypothetical protein [Paenibacillus sp. EPM92]